MKKLEIFRDFVAGVAYHDYQKVKKLGLKSKVVLYPEPTNQYDKNAIRVVIDGFTCGHIPREYAKKFHEYKKNNPEAKFIASIVSYNKNNPTYRMICIKVIMEYEEKPFEYHETQEEF